VALVFVNHLQADWKEAPYPRYLVAARVIAQGSAVVGVIAAFWQLSWLAAVVIVISIVAAVLLYLAYYRRYAPVRPDSCTLNARIPGADWYMLVPDSAWEGFGR